MKRVTAKELMKEQNERYRKIKESEEKVTEDMKFNFYRKPYYMTANKEDV